MKKQHKKMQIDSFSGGLVTNQFESNIKPNEFSQLQNVDYLMRGGFMKRFGYSSLIPDAFTFESYGLITDEVVLDTNDLASFTILTPPSDGDRICVNNPTDPQTLKGELWIYNGTSEEWEAQGVSLYPTWFDETNFIGTKRSLCSVDFKVYKDKGDGTYENPSPTDPIVNCIIAFIDNKLVIMNYNGDYDFGDGNKAIMSSRIIYEGFTGMADTFKMGEGLNNELIITTGNGIYILRLICNSAETEYTFLLETLNDRAKIPNPTEYAILGGNGLASDIHFDTSNLIDASVLSILNVRSNPVISYLNNETEFRAYIGIEVGKTIGDYEFQWSVKKPGEETYSEIQAWKSGATNGEVFKYKPDTILNPDGSVAISSDFAYYSIKIEVRESADINNNDEYLLENHKVTKINENTTSENTTRQEINNCKNFIMANNRYLFFDNETPYVYKSTLYDYTYIPVNGILDFPDTKVTGLIKHRTGLLSFTPSTINKVNGKGDDITDINGEFSPYISTMVSSEIGCVAPNSVAVAESVVYFLSNDGLYGLDTISVDQYRIDLDKVSDNVDNICHRDTNACGVIYKNKYYLFYPNRNFALKLDYIYGRMSQQTNIPTAPFTVDKSDKIGFMYVTVIGDRLIGLNSNGDILEQNTIEYDPSIDLTELNDIMFDDGFFLDDGVPYVQIIATKNFTSFEGKEQNVLNKRLKQVNVISQNYAKKETGFYIEAISEFGKVINAEELITKVQVIDNVRQVTTELVRTPNIINKTGFKIGFSPIGSTDLGFYENTVSFINVKKSYVSKNFKFMIVNEGDQPGVIIGLGAKYILYNNPRV